MYVRSFAVWLVLAVLAIFNGVFRTLLLVPNLGESAGHILSTAMLSCIMLFITWLWIRWMRPGSMHDCMRIGALWLFLTIGFEFIAGHYAFGNPWEKLFADYNLVRGRIWVFVLLVELFAPAWAAWKRGLFASR